jgi:hypothetical protein
MSSQFQKTSGVSKDARDQGGHDDTKMNEWRYVLRM